MIGGQKIGVQKMNVQVEILGCKGATTTKITLWGWGSWMGYLQMGYVQVQWSVSWSDSWCLKLVKEIWVSSFSDFFFCNSFQSFAAENWEERRPNEEVALGVTSEIWWSMYNGGVLLWWPVSWDKVGLYLANTYRWPGASGFGDEYDARASQREHTGRSSG